MLQHQARCVCKERRNPLAKEARVKKARARERARDAEQKRLKYAPKLLKCQICAGPVRKWVGFTNRTHALHFKCFSTMLNNHLKRDPVYSRREGHFLCPFCKAPNELKGVIYIRNRNISVSNFWLGFIAKIV